MVGVAVGRGVGVFVGGATVGVNVGVDVALGGVTVGGAGGIVKFNVNEVLTGARIVIT